jgi:hypothetical protein
MKRPAFSGLGELVTRRGVIATATAFGMSALACFPAGAQSTYSLSSKQSTPVSLKDCSREEDGGLRAICESVNRTEQAKARGAAADQRGAAADQLKICLLELQEFKIKSPDKFDALGPITRENACSMAAKVKPTAGTPKPSG